MDGEGIRLRLCVQRLFHGLAAAARFEVCTRNQVLQAAALASYAGRASNAVSQGLLLAEQEEEEEEEEEWSDMVEHV